MLQNPFVHFKVSVSPICIKYTDQEEGFFQLISYVFSLTGGILAVLRLIYNIGLRMINQRRVYQ